LVANAVINALVSGLLGVISFVIIKQIVAAQTTTDWSGAEIAVIGIIPIVLGVLVVVGMFMALGKMRGKGEE
jgi:uncharacterized membrane protein YcjF (UPF0283 family)